MKGNKRGPVMAWCAAMHACMCLPGTFVTVTPVQGNTALKQLLVTQRSSWTAFCTVSQMSELHLPVHPLQRDERNSYLHFDISRW